MLRSVKEIFGYKIVAKDGEIGNVEDFLFDDEHQTIRYLVVKTDRSLNSKQIIIPPAALEQPDWAGQFVPLSLNKEQAATCPPIDADRPVSRHNEQAVHEFLSLKPYWLGARLPDADPVPTPPGKLSETGNTVSEGGATPDAGGGESRLRSCSEVLGYTIMGNDSDCGHVEDFIVDDQTWDLQYLVVDTRNLLPGKKVLLAMNWIETIQWSSELVKVDISTPAIKDSPEFDPTSPVNREYEEVLYDYYGRPRYWQ